MYLPKHLTCEYLFIFIWVHSWKKKKQVLILQAYKNVIPGTKANGETVLRNVCV